MAPITKSKSLTAASSKLGTSSIGKTLGKNSTGNTTKANTFWGSSGKSNKSSASEKSSSFLGATGKMPLLDSSSKFHGSNERTSSFLGSSSKESYMGSSVKTSKLSDSKSNSILTGKKNESLTPSIKSKEMHIDNSKAKNTNYNESFGKRYFTTESKNSNLKNLSDKTPKYDANQSYPSFVNPKSNKSRSGFGIIWIPTRKHNKKKDAVYNAHNYDNYKDRSPSMYNNYMSGDSPDYQPVKKKEEETLLVPEKPKVASVAVNTGITAANIDMPPISTEPTNVEEKQELIRRETEDSKEAAGDANSNENKEDKEYLEKSSEKSPESKWDKDREEDIVDSVYLRPPPAHKARSSNSNEEEECGIKCLYYTLQCCDCVLM